MDTDMIGQGSAAAMIRGSGDSVRPQDLYPSIPPYRGGSRQIAFGRFGAMTVQQRCDEARIKLGVGAHGSDPAEEAGQQETITIATWTASRPTQQIKSVASTHRLLQQRMLGWLVSQELRSIMHLTVPTDLDRLAEYISPFTALVGRKRWFRRADQLDAEQRKSPYRWKIVADYHWLEMAISYQEDILAKEGRLIPELTDALILAALNFAAITVKVHAQLSSKGRRVLEGRLRDALKADTGFAPLYLELDLAQRLMDSGYDIQFADMDGVAQFDLVFSRGAFVGEVECKSLSADAGRQIHRKDFYRFMESIAPALATHMDLQRQEVLVITLEGRLLPNRSDQAELLQSVASILHDGAPTTVEGFGFKLERRPYVELLAGAPTDDQKAFHEACNVAFGPNTHIAGGLTEQSGCLVVMRSQRDDDTSKPMLEAMRKAASQFSGQRPAFIAIQEHGIEAADLMLPHVRRRTGILSYALFGHYGAAHVNATYVTGFGAIVAHDGRVGTPAFAIPNPEPAFPISTADAAPFLMFISDADYANLIGAPLPAPNISFLPIKAPRNADDGAI